jgi:hypothetical protein
VLEALAGDVISDAALKSRPSSCQNADF